MSRFMETKSNNPKSNQEQLPQELSFSAFSVKSFKDEINLWSPYQRKETKEKNGVQRTF